MPRGREETILPHPAVFVATTAVAAVAWSLAAWLWSAGNRAFAVSLVLLGLSLGPCLTGYATAPRALKQQQRRVVLFAGGLSILAPALLATTSLDLEGFFALLLAGTGGAAIGHTLVTVIAGPLVFGRVLCGWGCWRAMVLELLPRERGRGRRRGLWLALPYVGLATSAGAAAFGYHVQGHRPGAAACRGCGACTLACPMDVEVAALAAAGRPVVSGECALCQRCVQACPTGALHLAFGPSRPPPARGVLEDAASSRAR